MVREKLKSPVWYPFVIILIFSAILYVNTIPNAYSLDDTLVTENNPKVLKGVAGIPEILTSRYSEEEGSSFGYRPVTLITFAIGHVLWGQNPHMGHLVNWLLYALILLVLYNLLRKIFKDVHILFLLAIVLLFAAHPIHTEAVASLKNRETLLSFLFSLVSLSFFLKWYDSRRILPVIWGSLFFVLAFLSKQDSITFAAVIPLVLYFYSPEPWPLPKWGRISLKPTAAGIFILLACISFVLFLYASGRLGAWISGLFYFLTLILLLIQYLGHKSAHKSTVTHPFSWLLLAAGLTFFLLVVIFSKLVFAVLSLVCFAVFFLRIFEHPKINLPKPSPLLLKIVIPLLILGLAGILIYKLPDLYLPVEDKVPYKFENPQFVGDPQYATGPVAFYSLFFYLQKLVWPHPLGFYYGFKMIPGVGWSTPEVLFSIVFHLGILIFALIKLRRKHFLSFAILYYFITISIFSNIVLKIPGIVGERMAFFASLGFCMALAWLLFRILKIDIHKAVIPRPKINRLIFLMLLILVPWSVKTITRNTRWKDYLTLFSHDMSYLSNSAMAHKTYGNQLLKEAYGKGGKDQTPEKRKEYLDLAMKHLTRAVEIDPTYKFAWNNLGYVSYQHMADKNVGIGYMLKAIEVDPDYENAHYNIGVAYKQQKQFEKSILHFREAQRINPKKLVYLYEEADAWYQQGDTAKAVRLNLEAARKDPKTDVPFVNIGNICWLSRDTVQAIANWEKAFTINRGNLDLCLNLEKYFRGRDKAKANAYQDRAIELRRHK